MPLLFHPRSGGIASDVLSGYGKPSVHDSGAIQFWADAHLCDELAKHRSECPRPEIFANNHEKEVSLSSDPVIGKFVGIQELEPIQYTKVTDNQVAVTQYLQQTYV